VRAQSLGRSYFVILLGRKFCLDIDEFLREIAVNFLEEENGAVRREAAVAVSQLLVRILVAPTRSTSPVLLAEVIERLLVLGISDPDPAIRRTVLENLDSRLDNYLADSENLRSLFIALNDEEFVIRELAIGIIGRLALRSPAYVMPSLRRTLIQQLTELEFSGDSRIKEESAKLLAASIRSAKHLMEPFVKPILKALLPKLDPSQDPRVRQEVLAALGELSLCAQAEIVPHLDLLMPIILLFLEDSSSSSRRETALQVLGQLAQNVTSSELNLLSKYPNIISALLEIIKVEKSRPLRQLCLRVLGLLGAADPYMYKMILLQNSPEKSTAEEDNGVGGLNSTSPFLDSNPEHFYPFAAVSALVDILRDRSLGAYHAKCVMALIQIAKECLGDQSKIQHVLPLMMPPFLDVLRGSQDHSMFVFMFERLAMLVSIVARSSARVSALRPFLEQLLAIIEDAWQSPQLLPHVLTLVEDFSFTFGDEFKVYLPVLIPKLLSVLHPDNADLCPRILRNLEIIGANLDDYLHLITPAVMKLISQMENDTADVRKLAIKTIGRLCRILNFAEFASRIIHPLARLLQQPVAAQGDDLQTTIMNTMCHLIYQLGSDYATFIPMMNRILLRQTITHPSYDLIVTKLLKSQPILESDLPSLGDLPREKKGSTQSASIPVGSGGVSNSSAIQSPAALAAAAEANVAETKQINEANLKKVWGASQQSTKEDWAEWMRTFSVALVRESPEPAIRFCFELAQEYYPLVRSLFNSAFLSCWNALNKPARAEFIDNLRIALKSPHMPPEILQMWLNAAEFLEHARLPLPIELKELGRLANKCRAYAKALHYKELEFQTTRSSEIIESLIFLNNELQQPEAAEGILSYAQQSLSVDLKETWYEKLHRWEDALQVYQKKPTSDPQSRLGMMRSLHALGEWEKLLQLSEDMWKAAESDQMRELIAPWAAAAACNLHKFDALQSYLLHLNDNNVDTVLMKTLSALQKAGDSADSLQEVREMVGRSRDLIDTELTALVAESYQRAYDALVSVQILSEMEEIIDMRLYPRRSDALLTKVWPARLSRCERSVKTWQRVLAFRSVADVGRDSWLKFAALCRKKGALRQSHKVLIRLLGIDPSRQPMAPIPTTHPDVTYQYILQLWAAGAKDVAYPHMVKFERSIGDSDNNLRAKCSMKLGSWLLSLSSEASESQYSIPVPADQVVETVLENLHRAVELDPRWHRAWHMWATCNFEFASDAEKRLRSHRDDSSTDQAQSNSSSSRGSLLSRFIRAGSSATLTRSRFSSLSDTPTPVSAAARSDKALEESLMKHAEAAVRGFFKSISLSVRSETLQDTLRVLTLWFKHGGEKRIETALNEGFNSLSVETWIQVIPQLIARMDTPNAVVRKLVADLLARIGKEHPQALVYPLSLAAKSQVSSRQMMAQSLMEQMRSTNAKQTSSEAATLLDQAIDVSKELIRVSITLFEAWHEALEEASQLFFTQSNSEQMLEVLRPLHLALRRPPETILDAAFRSTYSGMLNEAWHWCEQYSAAKHKVCLNQAWDLYYHTFKSISRQLEKMTTLELRTASPRLLEAKLLDLAVPGTYEVGKPVVRIASFHPTLQIISSKQRPRKLRMKGSNGLDYAFLLKGHEDLRQDERVMQLFGLINNLLAKSQHTAASHLRIKRMSVIPLAPNSGLIGWVPHCDTLHQLIKEYRSTCEPKIPFNLEFKLLNHMSGDYNSLLVIQKIEVFKYTLGKTDGKDLAKIMWLKSPSSEVWLDRRTNFTRSLAVMSQAGYILGLGDRHPSNIMVDRATGHVVHIDFGDCFEVANLRDKFPEKVPFRLTRMLINAMEVSGIEGTYRTTSEKVMSVLRENRDSVMAVLEAFVYDPLINWRLLQPPQQDQPAVDAVAGDNTNVPPGAAAVAAVVASVEKSNTSSGASGAAAGKDVAPREGRAGDEQELNERAVAVINRVHKKLTGRDFEMDQSADDVLVPSQTFSSEEEQRALFERVKPKGLNSTATKPLSVQDQVYKLIQQATSHENLCQAYQGWCPFW
jgi:serine/threonine-protein kinase mTOR